MNSVLHQEQKCRTMGFMGNTFLDAFIDLDPLQHFTGDIHLQIDTFVVLDVDMVV